MLTFPTVRLIRATLGAVGLFTALLACNIPAATAEQVLKIGYLLPIDSQLGAGAAAFDTAVRKATDNRYRLEQYPNAALGGEVEMIKAVQAGQIDLAFITNAPFSNIVPETGLFDIPFLFRDTAHAEAVLDGPIGQSYLAKLSTNDMIALAWGANGLRHVTNNRGPIKGPADLRGLKLRVPQSDVMVRGFQALGAIAESLPFPQLYSALESNRFDGQENPIATIQSAKFDRVQKHLTMSAHIYSWAVFIMAKDTFDELTPADQAAFRTAATAGRLASRQYAAAAEQKGVDALAANGMAVVKTIDRPAFEAALKPAMDAYASQFGADTLARIQNAK